MGRCAILCVSVFVLVLLGFCSAEHSGYYVLWISQKCSKIVCVGARIVCYLECSNAVLDTVDAVFRLAQTKFDFAKYKNFDFPKFARYADYAIAFVRNRCLRGSEVSESCSRNFARRHGFFASEINPNHLRQRGHRCCLASIVI